MTKSYVFTLDEANEHRQIGIETYPGLPAYMDAIEASCSVRHVVECLKQNLHDFPLGGCSELYAGVGVWEFGIPLAKPDIPAEIIYKSKRFNRWRDEVEKTFYSHNTLSQCRAWMTAHIFTDEDSIRFKYEIETSK